MEHTEPENAVNDTLKEIQQMVDTVKTDEEASLHYMKVYEREEMLIDRGRREEQVNTERERQRAEAEKSRADMAEFRANAAELENQRLKRELEQMKTERRNHEQQI